MDSLKTRPTSKPIINMTCIYVQCLDTKKPRKDKSIAFAKSRHTIFT